MSEPVMRAITGLVIAGVLAALLFWLDPVMIYPWLKALHILAVISWMAGMLYLPRLFVYHSQAEKGSAQSETFKIMERRLLRAIINPAMTITWVVGLWLAWRGFQFSGMWLHLKIALVFAMSGVHGHFSKAVRDFAEDNNDKSDRYWRVMNEVPTVLMIFIVVLVVVKPFSG
jgi:protoporphyrinogen IX oxidase